jgi:hypothetical protein
VLLQNPLATHVEQLKCRKKLAKTCAIDQGYLVLLSVHVAQASEQNDRIIIAAIK